MSIELRLEKTRGGEESFVGAYEAWLERCPFEIVRVTDLERSEGELAGFLFLDGSVRGMQIGFRERWLGGGRVTVFLNALASRTDWLGAFRLLAALAKRLGGKVRAPWGETLDLDNTSDGQLCERWQALLERDIAEMAAAAEERDYTELRLPGDGYTLPLEPAELLQATESPHAAYALLESLAERARVFEDTFRPPVMRAPTGETVVLLLTEEGAPASVFPEADLIAVVREDRELAALPWAAGCEILGTRLSRSQDDPPYYYLKPLAIDSPEDHAALDALIEKAAPYGPGGQPSES